ncbi:MAG: hypothetical protein CL843_07705 [Crocinitomicaceae bacterium]|nr:hypothetical protein [Crocinitomicaceae bacterium]|tara:strand:+ start:9453 stop:9731 length:279 start_codon:yes stop_codon:yes gene_type:complete
MNSNLAPYIPKLFKLIALNNFENQAHNLVYLLHHQGYSKADIYALFIEFHETIQTHQRFKTDEEKYNRLCNFMDRFTAWSKTFKILPEEPDL